MWQTIGNYRVALDSDTFRIFPKDRHGNTRPVTISRHCIHLRPESGGTQVTFKRYLHQGQWYWSDSRVKGPVAESVVIGEIARMLYSGDRAKATGLMANAAG